MGQAAARPSRCHDAVVNDGAYDAADRRGDGLEAFAERVADVGEFGLDGFAGGVAVGGEAEAWGGEGGEC